MAMPSFGRGAAGDDSPGLLRELSARPPAELARWALGQLRELAAPTARAEQSSLVALAAAARAAPRQERQALVRSTVAGLAGLSAEERADVLRLALQGAELFGEEPLSKPAQEAPPPPLVVNLLKVANAARLEEVPPETWAEVAEVAQAEAAQALRPQDAVAMLTQLGAGERAQFAQVLVQAQVIPKEQRGTVEAAVRPGGYVEKLQPVLAWATVAHRYAPAFAALPLLELLLAYRVLSGSGGGLLVAWLRLDAWLTLVLSAAAASAWRSLGPVRRQLEEDPLGAWHRGSSAVGSLGERLQAAFPGMPSGAAQRALLGAGCTAALAFGSLAWAVFGALLMPVAALFHVRLGTFMACAVIIGLRITIIAAVASAYLFVRRLILRQPEGASIPVGAYAPLRT